MLAVLEQGFLLHVVRGEDVLLLTLLVLVRAVLLWAAVVLQEELAILGPTIGSPY